MIHGPEDQNDDSPQFETRSAFLAHAICTAEETHVYILSSDMAVDDTSNDNRGDSDAVGIFCSRGELKPSAGLATLVLA